MLSKRALSIRRRCKTSLRLLDPSACHREAFEQVHEADFLNQMLYLDTKIFMVSLNLTYNDKMSMASSVEVRVPFLDRELAEFVAWNVPPHLEAQGIFSTHHEVHLPPGHEGYFAARGLRAAQGRLCRAR